MSNNPNLINRFQDGDQQALSEIYDHYSGALYGVLLRMCRQEAVAQDVLQETFITIWEKRGSYDPQKGRFYTWAYRIAKNTALNAVRKSDKLIQNEDLSVLKNKGVTETEISFSLL